MTARSTIRPLVCYLLALCLCAPLLATASRSADRDQATEFRALAAPSSTVLLNAGGGRNDHVRQRSSSPSLFTPVPLRAGLRHADRGAATAERLLLRSIWTAGPWTGRAPPPIS